MDINLLIKQILRTIQLRLKCNSQKEKTTEFCERKERTGGFRSANTLQPSYCSVFKYYIQLN